MTADVMTFLGIVLVLTVTPGADMALVMRHVLAHGFRSTWPTLAGIKTGLLVHVTLSVTGLSLMLQQSPLAFTIVKLVGAAWLAWLGLSAVWAALHPRVSLRSARDDTDTTPADAVREQVAAVEPSVPGWRTLYLRGLLTNLFNVKILLFYVAFLPQFAPSGSSFVPVAIVLATVQVVIGFTWLATYGLIVARTGRALESSPLVLRWLEGSTGIALIAFGARLAAVAR